MGWPPTEVPGPYHADPGGVPPENPLPNPLCILGTWPLPSASPGKRVPTRHPKSVGRLQVYAGHYAGLEDHPHSIIGVGVEAHHVKEAHQYVQGRLEADWLQLRQYPAVRIKERCKQLVGLSKTMCIGLPPLTSAIQYRMKVSTNMLKMVTERGYTWVTPHDNWRGAP